MTAQLELEIADLVTPDYAPEATIQERYEAWRDANPWVIPAIARLLDEWSDNGGRKVGVKSAAEVIRWRYQAVTRDAAGFKINNSYVSRVARDVIARFPHLASVIETRELRSQ